MPILNALSLRVRNWSNTIAAKKSKSSLAYRWNDPNLVKRKNQRKKQDRKNGQFDFLTERRLHGYNISKV